MASNAAALAQNAVDIARLDPDWFCETILNSPNDLWQSEMLNAIADLDRIRYNVSTKYNHTGKNRFTVRAFHGPGKTHFIAKLMHWWNFTRQGRIPCTAPKEKQLKTRLWPEFRKLRNGAEPWYQKIMKVDSTHIAWFNNPDWCALAETASNPDNLAGHHAEHLLFLVEEASGVDDKMFEVIEGALTTEGAVLVMIGNPTNTDGEFYRSFTKRGTSDLYYKKHIGHHETTRIKKEWVEGMIAKYGEQSPIVQVRVFGEFVEMSKNQLNSLGWIERARGKDAESDGSLSRLRITADIADGGTDETVITIARHYASFTHFMKQLKFSFPASEAPILAGEKVIELYELYDGKPENGDDCAIDAIGVGAGATGICMRSIPTIPFKGGNSSSNPKMWRNRRVQSYLVARNRLRDNMIVINEDFCEDEEHWEEFLHQMTSIRSRPGIERVEDLETKEQYCDREGKSPDCADSFIMQFTDQVPQYAESGLSEGVVVVGQSFADQYDAGIAM